VNRIRERRRRRPAALSMQLEPILSIAACRRADYRFKPRGNFVYPDRFAAGDDVINSGRTTEDVVKPRIMLFLASINPPTLIDTSRRRSAL